MLDHISMCCAKRVFFSFFLYRIKMAASLLFGTKIPGIVLQKETNESKIVYMLTKWFKFNLLCTIYHYFFYIFILWFVCVWTLRISIYSLFFQFKIKNDRQVWVFSFDTFQEFQSSRFCRIYFSIAIRLLFYLILNSS